MQITLSDCHERNGNCIKKFDNNKNWLDKTNRRFRRILRDQRMTNRDQNIYLERERDRATFDTFTTVVVIYE